MRYYTPLRYPGGKARLGQYMRQIFVDNGILDGMYIEPYAGGAGIALELLMTGYAREIWLNDIDPAIYAFWQATLHDMEALIELVETTPLTLAEWRRQKTIYLNPAKHDILSHGFATFYLNRTNRSGILNGGVIGGISQKGQWLIDARFNRRGLAERIRRIGQYSHRIHLSNEDAEAFLQRLQLPPKSLVYLDPPYFQKGQRMYRNHYEREDHARIADLVQNGFPHRWIVSYDDTPEISKLYAGRRRIRYTLDYTAQVRRRGGELMIFCDALRLPKASNPAQFRFK
ncbi:MAG: DNA adenine methylase [Candidatus Brocadiales bacterium]|nr:DNA adenine methylase [Candidatus Bathyanammoxibius sp.]